MTHGDRVALTAEAEQRIADVVRSLTGDKVDRGVDLNRPMRCDSCDMEKSPYGSSQYGAYALCNDCLLEFTILLARGEVNSVAEYMTKQPDEVPVVFDPPGQREADRRPAPKLADKLMPSNEPV